MNMAQKAPILSGLFHSPNLALTRKFSPFNKLYPLAHYRVAAEAL